MQGHSSTLFCPVGAAQVQKGVYSGLVNALPSAVQEGWYKKTLCPCGMEQIETTEHVLLWCTYYKDIRDKLVSPLTGRFSSCTEQKCMHVLLSDSNPMFTHSVAKFFTAAMGIRKRILKVNEPPQSMVLTDVLTLLLFTSEPTIALHSIPIFFYISVYLYLSLIHI